MLQITNTHHSCHDRHQSTHSPKHTQNLDVVDRSLSRIRQPLVPSCGLRNSPYTRSSARISSGMSTSVARSESPPAARRLRSPSPTSSSVTSLESTAIPSSITQNPQLLAAWLDARTQYAPDEQVLLFQKNEILDEPQQMEYQVQRVSLESHGRKRKQSAFIKEEALKCFHEDLVGTSHISELQADLEVIPLLTKEEMGLGGEIDTLLLTSRKD